MESYSFRIHATDQASVTMANIKREAVGLSAEMKSLAGAAFGIGSLFMVGSFMKTTLDSFDKFEQSTTMLKSAIQSTGGAAGITFDRFRSDADKLSGTVIFPKSSIIEAESMLAMFTDIHSEMMTKTLPVAADLATKFGMDIPTAAKLLGRSLENLQLGRLGMQLGKMSDAQTAQIVKFKTMGDTARAQAVILDFVRDKVGGLSEAMAKTDAGKLKMAAKTMNDFKIEVGGAVSKLLIDLIPTFKTVMGVFKDFVEWLISGSISAKIFRDVVIAVAAAIIGYNIVMGAAKIATVAMTVAQWALNTALWASGIPEIILAVVGLVVAIGLLWDKCEGFRRAVVGIFEEIKKVVIGMIHVWTNLSEVMADFFSQNYIEAAAKGQKFISDFKHDLIDGWKETWKEGSEIGAHSTFKFGDILKKAKLEIGIPDPMHKAGGGGVSGAIGQSALNTSLLGGASGGLGEAKTIKIDFHSPLMSINVPGGNGQDIINKAPMTMEMLLRILNNLALSQGSTM